MRAFGALAGALSFTVVLFRVKNESNTENIINSSLQSISGGDDVGRRGLNRDGDELHTTVTSSNKGGLNGASKRVLRRKVFRVTNDVAESQQENGSAVSPSTKKFRTRTATQSYTNNLDYGAARHEESSYWARVLQENSMPPLNKPPQANATTNVGGNETMASGKNSTEAPTGNNSTEASTVAPVAATPPPDSDRFNFFVRDGPPALVFDILTIQVRSNNDRYGDWMMYRNSDHTGEDRFRRSCVSRLVGNDGEGSGSPSVRSLSSVETEARIGFSSMPPQGFPIHDRAFLFGNMNGRDRFGVGSMQRLENNFVDNDNQHVSLDLNQKQVNIARPLDFFVAGFPKCGSSTLLNALNKHKETVFSLKEQCDIAQPTVSEQTAYSKLNKALAELPASSSTKVGVKCSTGLKSLKGIERLQTHSPTAHLVIGVQHPVKFFESFYNDRITEIYTKSHHGTIPPAEDLVGSNEWRGVSTDKARFELFLMQLGKAKLNARELAELARRPEMGVVPTPSIKIFLYSLEQLQDDSKERAASFRQELQGFLHLQEPLGPFERDNMDHFVVSSRHAETFDICGEEYSDVRALLVSQATETREWFRNKFLASPDVIVGGKEHFLQLLDTWEKDPCQVKELFTQKEQLI